MELDKATYDRQNGFLKRIGEALKAQGTRSVNEKGNCQYRGKDGMKCALGVLIKDEFYTPDMERATLMRHASGVKEDLDSTYGFDMNRRANLLDAALEASGVKREDFPLLDSIQTVHDLTGPDYDKPASGPEWYAEIRKGLRRIAIDKGLDPTVVPE